MRQEKGKCSECGENKWLRHKAKKLCDYCNEIRKAKQKKKEGKKPYRYKRKPTGERAVFLQIWESRPHRCEHCGRSLDLPRAHYFAHIKSKGNSPNLRLDPKNIRLLCYNFIDPSDSCHFLFDHGTSSEFESRKNLFS